MEWNELEVLTVVVVIVGFFFAKKIDELTKEVTLLKSNVDNLNAQVPKWEPGDNGRLFQRIESLEYQVFGACGNKIDYGHNRMLSSRLSHLEHRLEAGARWLKLDNTNDESKTELDNVTFCIRAASYQMLNKPE
jgi:hypothetical protein